MDPIDIYNTIKNGEIGRSIQLLKHHFPEIKDTHSTDEGPSYYETLMYKLTCQQFIEILRSRSEIEAVEFAHQHLRSDHKLHKTMTAEVASLIAYKDPNASISNHLLGEERRVVLAEQVNKAILKLSGLPTDTALERLLRQQEALKQASEGLVNHLKKTRDPNTTKPPA
ncbi:CTLH/CRA C-terminal to lish motif domain-containing protein [Spinellus fusiger]|nr:CTLH/CRA C-terminal to lish motif domain-containing protein [Spinellus fusiger]